MSRATHCHNLSAIWVLFIIIYLFIIALSKWNKFAIPNLTPSMSFLILFYFICSTCCCEKDCSRKELSCTKMRNGNKWIHLAKLDSYAATHTNSDVNKNIPLKSDCELIKCQYWCGIYNLVYKITFTVILYLVKVHHKAGIPIPVLMMFTESKVHYWRCVPNLNMII